jgi:hypothetical protein
MLDHLFGTYGNITAVDLEINFEHMRRAWDPQQPVESLFKQIQDCADYSEAGVKLLPLPQPPLRARTDAHTNPSAQRATQLRSVLARVYAVSR